MRQKTQITRRHALAGLTALAVGLPMAAQAQTADLVADSDADQSAALQAALDGASGRVTLPAGRFRVSNINFPANLVVEGVPGATVLVASGTAIGGFLHQSGLVLRDIGFTGDSGNDPLFGVQGADNVTIERCRFSESPGIALSLFESAATIRDCDFENHGDAAIHSLDSTGLLASGNTISGCGNAGIRIWRNEAGPDGSILVNNRISKIDWRQGGNGQNGNGINVYLADEVVVADNHISDCAFTAVRLNTTKNCQVTGNICRTCGEVAIFSEFGFSGSIIADNVVDGAATGISITNLDTEGHIAICSNNMVRNISEKSAVNPDTMPIGILAEAETAVTGNLVSNVPGVGIAAGWGQFLRNVAITDNVVHDSMIGIGVSVVDGAGPVHISGNLVTGATRGDVVGLEWREVAETDLEANADRYPNVTVR
ncbi:MAG: TIGR03808 family TAT-translocated repetitive protein [Devosia sp.]|uniref:TIGR03808 family TAT-translocated repetitive protein n=1 Tax=Devosia sp. TaxID=1871048 RepID=UPI00339ABF9A